MALPNFLLAAEVKGGLVGESRLHCGATVATMSIKRTSKLCFKNIHLIGMARKRKASAPPSDSESDTGLAPANKVQRTNAAHRSVSTSSNKSLSSSTESEAAIVVSDGESDDPEELEKLVG
jgi:hypothetical protein